LAPEPARSIVDFLGLKRMPSLVSMTSSLVPSSILYFLRSLAGIVVWPFLVTTTSVSISIAVVQMYGRTYKLSYQICFKAEKFLNKNCIVAGANLYVNKSRRMVVEVWSDLPGQEA